MVSNLAEELMKFLTDCYVRHLMEERENVEVPDVRG